MSTATITNRALEGGGHLGTNTAARIGRALGSIAARVMLPLQEMATRSHNLMGIRSATHDLVLTRGIATTIPLTGTSHHHTQNQSLLQPVLDRDQQEPVLPASRPYVVPVRFGPALRILRLGPAPVLDQPEVSPTTAVRPNRDRDTPARRDGMACST